MLEVGVWGKSGVNLQLMSLEGGQGTEKTQITADFTGVWMSN